MTNHAISGAWEWFYTFCYVEYLRFMGTLTRKSSKWSRLGITISTPRSSMMSLISPKNSSRRWSPLSKIDSIPSKSSSILGSLKNKTWISLFNYKQSTNTVVNIQINPFLLIFLLIYLLIYLASSDFKKLILTILASKLSEHEISNIGQVYNNVDKNKDGQLSIGELISGLNGISMEQAKEWKDQLMSLDTDNSGQISYTGIHMIS